MLNGRNAFQHLKIPPNLYIIIHRMELYKLNIFGAVNLRGSLGISGAKNAALPELAASLLTESQLDFRNIPDVGDIRVMLKALSNCGGTVISEKDVTTLIMRDISNCEISGEITATSRASILILGPLLARMKYAKVSFPGGCPIGDRKVNFHLDGLSKMGAEIELCENNITARTKGLKGIDYRFPGKSVTGTENLIMAATLAEGTTILRNCAIEPEISDLIDLLVKMGAEIEGKDSETITIKGRKTLNGAEHSVVPDRIEMGTYAIAGCFEGNSIELIDVIPAHIDFLLDLLRKIGAYVETGNDFVRVKAGTDYKPVDIITAPYPGYPTDLQAQLTTLMTVIPGESTVTENIFNNRFQHTTELNKMGADIVVDGNRAVIKGGTPLRGATLVSTDLRASAALVLGGLIAEGNTVVHNAAQLFRGYEDLPGKLNSLGADIKVQEDSNE